MTKKQKQKKKIEKKYSLGSNDFVDGVCFVIEELLLLGFQNKDSVVDLLEESALVSYKGEIFDKMKKNNPDIFNDYLLPILKTK